MPFSWAPRCHALITSRSSPTQPCPIHLGSVLHQSLEWPIRCPRVSPNARRSKPPNYSSSLMCYILLPQLIFRTPGKSSKKNNEVIIIQCVAFLNGNYGALLNKWEADRNKALLRPRHKRKPEDEKAHLKRVTDDILNAKPHCISRGAARILGNGLGSCNTNHNQRPDAGETPASNVQRNLGSTRTVCR
jgi:hypothetical protein